MIDFDRLADEHYANESPEYEEQEPCVICGEDETSASTHTVSGEDVEICDRCWDLKDTSMRKKLLECLNIMDKYEKSAFNELVEYGNIEEYAND